MSDSNATPDRVAEMEWLTDADRATLRDSRADWRCLRCGRTFSITSDHESGGRFCKDTAGRSLGPDGKPW